ncbi:hypothetical protein U0070_018070 [Myodes glareolus]|uniref:Uncharacterized protein n=1 Tax=Myodes glareolus TaxID=447135 RepID=A0AAW0IKM3_MYOGA
MMMKGTSFGPTVVPLYKSVFPKSRGESTKAGQLAVTFVAEYKPESPARLLRPLGNPRLLPH